SFHPFHARLAALLAGGSSAASRLARLLDPFQARLMTRLACGEAAVLRLGRHHARSRTISPRSPLGRKIRIRIRMENATMSLYSAPKAPPVSSDRYEAANASSSPRTRPPIIAPGMLPMPPSTAAVNAL